jgi:hypothetical protein
VGKPLTSKLSKYSSGALLLKISAALISWRVRVRDADPVRVVAIGNALLEVYQKSGGRTIIVHELPRLSPTETFMKETRKRVLGGLAGWLVSPLLARLLMVMLQKLTKTKHRNAR